MKHKNYLKDVKVGDKLYSIEYGWMKVINIDSSSVYQIELKNDNTLLTCTYDGKILSTHNSTIFWNKPKISKKCYIKPQPKITFKSFLESNNVDIHKFATNCLTENQRWKLIKEYYKYTNTYVETMIERFNNDKLNFIQYSFNWKHNILNMTTEEISDLNATWKELVKNNLDIKFM